MNELSQLFKESDTQLGVFYPKHYVLAAFRDLSAATEACSQLRHASFTDEDAFAIPGQQLLDLAKDESGLGNFLMQGLSRFFATEQVATDQDLQRARLGAAFVAVYCPSELRKQEAWQILEHQTPLAARYYGADGIEHLAGDFVTN